MQQEKRKFEKGEMAEIWKRVNELRVAQGKRKVTYNHVRLCLRDEREMSDEIEVVTEVFFEQKAKQPKIDLRAFALEQAARSASN